MFVFIFLLMIFLATLIGAGIIEGGLWTVLAPIWVPIVIILGVIFIIIIGAFVLVLFEPKSYNKRNY